MDTSSEALTQPHQILIVSEDACQKVIGRHEAFQAVESVFSSMAKGSAYNFPVVREAIGHANALYGFKSGFDREGLVLGVKAGGYWPGNVVQGRTNHQSIVALFDPDTGQLKALVSGNYLTAIRTAASSAVSIAHLARKNAKVLGMIGAGFQSTFQLHAALEQRDFEKVVAWNTHPEHLTRLADVCREHNLPFEAVSLQALGSQSDVIITITSASEPLLQAAWVKPGTHLACMGTDTKGKQEIDHRILAQATVFTDEIDQSISIGEAQHAVTARILSAEQITPIGEVINGLHQGRQSEQEITLFDGTGVGLQDLAVASAAASLAEVRGLAQRVTL